MNSSFYLFLGHLQSDNLEHAFSGYNINALTRINFSGEFNHFLDVFKLHPTLSSPDKVRTALENIHSTYPVLGEIGIDIIGGRNWPRISIKEPRLTLITHKSLEDEQKERVYAGSLREARERKKGKANQSIQGISQLIVDMFDCYGSISHNYGTSLIAYATPGIARELGIIPEI